MKRTIKGNVLQRLLTLIEEVEQGDKCILSASREICQLRLTDQLRVLEEDFLDCIVGFESECDGIPGPNQRDLWEKSAFEAGQKELARYVAIAGPIVLANFARLKVRLLELQ